MALQGGVGLHGLGDVAALDVGDLDRNLLLDDVGVSLAVAASAALFAAASAFLVAGQEDGEGEEGGEDE